ncbi:MAG: tetratricopeptide repeat protein [Sideroxydans sp.]|nr:tetratricopeptide repeat protein [Sideroxydans sp.]
MPDQLLKEAEALLNAGKPEEAYQLLSAKDFEYSGNQQFDYLLGIAALDSGHPDKATLAFERVLAIDPNFAGARLDMARAYFHLGDLPRAKTEFESVMKQEPPEAARITIEKYLAAIESAEDARKTRYSAYVEGAIGRDTNANNSTSQSDVAVPAFGDLVFTLNPTSLKTPATYFTAATGGEVTRMFNEQWSAYGGLDLRQRNNNKMHDFDSGGLDVRAGAAFAAGDEVFRLGVTWGFYEQAHVKNRNAAGLTGSWQHNFGSNDQLNLFGQYSRNRYSETTYQVNDFNQSVIGAGILHLMGDGTTVLFASLNGLKEAAVNDRADGSKVGFGLRFGGQMTFAEAWAVFVSAGYQRGRYDKENLAFLTKRDDEQYDAVLGSNWTFAKSWSLRPQLTYTRNKSNIAIYSFDRVDASLAVRRDFR